jgi:hypothetical protein
MSSRRKFEAVQVEAKIRGVRLCTVGQDAPEKAIIRHLWPEDPAPLPLTLTEDGVNNKPSKHHNLIRISAQGIVVGGWKNKSKFLPG